MSYENQSPSFSINSQLPDLLNISADSDCVDVDGDGEDDDDDDDDDDDEVEKEKNKREGYRDGTWEMLG